MSEVRAEFSPGDASFALELTPSNDPKFNISLFRGDGRPYFDLFFDENKLHIVKFTFEGKDLEKHSAKLPFTLKSNTAYYFTIDVNIDTLMILMDSNPSKEKAKNVITITDPSISEMTFITEKSSKGNVKLASVSKSKAQNAMLLAASSPKKSSTWWIILVSIAAAVVLLGVGAVVYLKLLKKKKASKK